MNKIKDFFLFKRSAKGLGAFKGIMYYVLNIIMMFGAPIAVGASSLLLAYGEYNRALFASYFNHPFILAMNMLLPIVSFVVLYGFTGRMWITQLIVGTVVLGFTTADYYLLKFRDDPLMFADIMYVREAAQINGRYDMTPGTRMIFVWALLFVSVVFLFFFGRMNIKKRFRVPLAVVLVCTLFVPLKNLYFDVDMYNNKAQNFEHINRWSSTQLYISKGFVYPFVHSIAEAFPPAPQDYSEEAARELLLRYDDEAIPEEKKVNIIGIMLEAYTDLSLIGVDCGELYAPYRALLDECYHGKLVTNIFAGGTIDSERAFLTGYSTLANYRKDTNSFVHYLTSQGYYANGSHPCYRWFYNRLNVNEYLGFKNYYFYEDYYSTLSDGIAVDSIVFPEIKAMYDIEKSYGEPYFGFHVTYQGHGPYSDSSLDWVKKPVYVNPNISEKSSNIINNYLGSVMNTTENLVNLIGQLKNEQEPVVLVFFGDHKPWLGDGNSVYNELSVNLDLSSYDGFMNYYSTEYAFWANDSAKAVLGRDFVGIGPTISPCFLMNELFSQCGFGGNAYMQFTDSIREVLPVINNNGYVDKNGNFTRYEVDLTNEQKEALKNFRIVEKYVSESFGE